MSWKDRIIKHFSGRFFSTRRIAEYFYISLDEARAHMQYLESLGVAEVVFPGSTNGRTAIWHIN